MKKKPFDAIIVLGAQLRPDGTPSETLRRRLVLAFETWQKRPVPILCCGAKGRNEPEAEGAFMARYLVALGVPARQAIAEVESYDTVENIRNARALLRQMGLSRPFLITSDYHLPRALAICKMEKLPPVGGAGSRSRLVYLPKNWGREVLAWGKFVLVYLFRLKIPTRRG